MKRPIGYEKLFRHVLNPILIDGEQFETEDSISPFLTLKGTKWPLVDADSEHTLLWIRPTTGFYRSRLFGDNVLCLAIIWETCTIEIACLGAGTGYNIREILGTVTFSKEDVCSFSVFVKKIWSIVIQSASVICQRGLYD